MKKRLGWVILSVSVVQFFSAQIFLSSVKLNVDASDAGVGTALFQDISDSVDGDISYLEKLQITIELFYHWKRSCWNLDLV